jgi:transcriptional regulator with XRE-family HTH domain
MSFGARLKEERRRLGLKQAEFAALVGTDMPRQSLYERGERQLRAAYLARLDSAGVDLLYVLTGRRSEVAALGEDATAIIAAYLSLPGPLREPVERFVGELTRYVEKGAHRGGGD